MTYSKQSWADNSASTPLSAARMSHIEDGIAAVDSAAATAQATAASAQTTANAAVPATQVGAASGVASLDATGKVPTAQVPDLSASYDQAGLAAALSIVFGS